MVFFIVAAVVAAGSLIGGAAYAGHKVSTAAHDVKGTVDNVSKEVNDKVDKSNAIVTKVNAVAQFANDILERFKASIEQWLEQVSPIKRASDKWAEIITSIFQGFTVLQAAFVYTAVIFIEITQKEFCDIKILSALLENRLALSLAYMYVVDKNCYEEAARVFAAVCGVPALISFLTYLQYGLQLMMIQLWQYSLYFCGLFSILPLAYLVIVYREKVKLFVYWAQGGVQVKENKLVEKGKGLKKQRHTFSNNQTNSTITNFQSSYRRFEGCTNKTTFNRTENRNATHADLVSSKKQKSFH